MDFGESAAERVLRQEARAWLASVLPEDWPERWSAHWANREELLATRRWWQGQLYEAGWAAVTWPRAYGGRDATPAELVTFTDELARACAPEPINVIGLNMVGPTLIVLGTDEQRRRYLAPLLSGDEIWCQGFSEPDSGSDLASIRTTAEPSGSSFLVNGRKIWTSYSPIGRFCLLLARTWRGSRPYQGLTCLIVDLGSPGVTVRPIRQMTGDEEFGEVTFDDVLVAQESVVGEPGDGWSVALRMLAHERGTMPFSLEIGTRILFRQLGALVRNLSCSGDHNIGSRFEEVEQAVESLRLANLLAVGRLMSGPPGNLEITRKLLWERAEQQITSLAMSILSRHGYPDDAQRARDHAAWSYHYLRCRARTIEAGTTEVLKDVVARRVLGLPRDTG
jgi:alkylation response protein AidB-like acyl-CoA dehydrogenase